MNKTKKAKPDLFKHNSKLRKEKSLRERMKTIFRQTFHHETELQKVNDLGGYANT